MTEDYKDFLRALAEGELGDQIAEILEKDELYKAAQEESGKRSFELSAAVKAYNERRLTLLHMKWEDEGVSLCSFCGEVNAEPKQYLLLEGERRAGEHYTYRMVPYTELHIACPECFQDKLDRRVAHRVEERPEGFFYNHFGAWRPLPEGTAIRILRRHIDGEWMKRWNIPPEIKLDRSDNPHIVKADFLV